MRNGLRCLPVMACLASPLLRAEAPLQLPPMLIEVTRDETNWLDTPAAVTRVGPGETQHEQGLSLAESLHTVPGLFALNRYNLAQGLRVSVRGFGARSGFGVRGIRVLVDGIPLTLPDGQTELDALDLGLVESLEVLRGPASALYGNAAGGVVALNTRPAPVVPAASLELADGALGARQLRAEAGAGNERLQGLVAVNARELDGYRAHSAASSEVASGKLHWDSGAGRMQLDVNALQASSLDPGALTATELRRDRRAASARNLRFNAGEDIRQQRLGLSWVAAAGPGWQPRLQAWGGQREFSNRLPFTAGGQSNFERDFAGIGGQLVWREDGPGPLQRITLGFDLEAQRDNRRRHDNLDGTRGVQVLHQHESARGAGLYLDGQFQPAEHWLTSVGLRYDHLRLAVNDRHLSDGDDSGARRFREPSYHLALGYAFTPAHLLYTRVGSAFESPTIAELANPAGGGFNPRLQAAQSMNHELGLKGMQDGLRYELVLFVIDVDDELLRFELPAQPGRSFFRNAGRSRREGVELAGEWRLAPHWRLNASYTHADYKFLRYQEGGSDYSGNEIPGLPRQQFFTSLGYQPGDWSVRLTLAATGRFYADDANATRVAGYTQLGIRVGRVLRGRPHWEPYLGINNILGHEYNDNIRINAGGQRYFEPAPGGTIYAGLKTSW